MFKQGKKSRNELRLPILHYVVVDDWIKKLGHDAFIAWLNFHTWVDRTDEKREYDKVPYSLDKVMELLGMGKKKFYQKVIRPLWNYYLIDIVEYEKSSRKSQKPKNIIVYESPMNKHETQVQPLVRLRDYDTEYKSASQIFGRKGGRPKEASKSDHGFQTETVDGFQKETVTVSEQKPNNYTNPLSHSLNTYTNESNQSNDSLVDSQIEKEAEAFINHALQGTVKSVKATQKRYLEAREKGIEHETLIQALEEGYQRYGKNMSPVSVIQTVIDNHVALEKAKKKAKEDKAKREARRDRIQSLLMEEAAKAGLNPTLLGGRSE